MPRLVSLLIVMASMTGCAIDNPTFKPDAEHPVAGEATPAPETGPRGGWAW